jgi:hypothetical protein
MIARKRMRSKSSSGLASTSAIGVSRRRLTTWVVGLLLLLVGIALAHPAWAQGCPLCYNTAAATGARGAAALRSGILILMVPPVMIVGVVCFLTVRGRNRFNDEVEGPELPAAECDSVPSLRLFES